MVRRVSRGADRAFCALLLAVLALALGCTVDSIPQQGRVCTDDPSCGPGAHCGPKNTCVVNKATKDASLPTPDSSRDKGPKKDLKPDQLVPDHKLPDAGCPSGLTQCGTTCVDLKTNFNHCGQCNKKCLGGDADKCVGGKCVCGSTGGPCTNGLNCQSGSCKCVPNGRCPGCCKNNYCIPLGPSQSATLCGNKGQTCASCSSTKKTVCQIVVCSSAGVCQASNLKDGIICDDKDSCSYNDKCATGICKGTKYSCNDGLTCTTDACTGTGPATGCTNTVNTGYCAIKKACYANGVFSSASKCHKCVHATDPKAWTLVDAIGCVTTLAGNGSPGNTNGAAATASFSRPEGVAVDSVGRVFVADTYNHVIRVISSGTVSTLAGVGVSGFMDGLAKSARFKYPKDVAVSSTGIVYVADSGNHKIRKISGGVVSTVAGTGSIGSTDSASPYLASFYSPSGLGMDTSGNIYVADSGNHRIRKLTLTSSKWGVTTFAGSNLGNWDAALLSAKFYSPHDVVVGSNSVIFVSDTGNHKIRRIYGGHVTTYTGTGYSGLVNGALSISQFYSPIGVSVYGSAPLYVGDYYNNIVRLVAKTMVSTLAGSTVGFMDGPLTSARFYRPCRVATYKQSAVAPVQVYVADSYNNRIRKITLNPLGQASAP